MRRPLLVLLAALLGACRPGPQDGEVPAPPDGTGLDPLAAELIEARRAAVAKDRDDAGAWLALGEAYEAHGLADLAAESHAVATHLAPGSPRAWLRLAVARRTLGQAGPARDAAERSVRAGGGAPALTLLATLELEAGDLEAARAGFERAVELDGASWPARVGLARSLLQADRPGDARTVLERLVRERPDDVRVAQLLASARRRAGQAATAPPRAARAPLPPTDPVGAAVQAQRVGVTAALARAEGALEAGRPEAALEALAAVPPSARETPSALLVEGVALVRLGRTAEGVRALSTFVERAPGRHEGHAHLAEGLLRAGRLEEAETHARRAVELGPSSSFAHETLGAVLRARGLRDAALTELDAAVRADPGRARASRLRGSLLFELGRPSEAARDFERSLASEPTDALATLGLAMALIETGELDRAEGLLERAARLDPDRAPQVRAATARLADLRARSRDGGP